MGTIEISSTVLIPCGRSEVYAVADSTRMTVSAQYAPKGLGRMFSGAREGAYRKQEAARLAALKKALERQVRLGKKG